jgi:hypothetical protein
MTNYSNILKPNNELTYVHVHERFVGDFVESFQKLRQGIQFPEMQDLFRVEVSFLGAGEASKVRVRGLPRLLQDGRGFPNLVLKVSPLAPFLSDLLRSAAAHPGLPVPIDGVIVFFALGIVLLSTQRLNSDVP